MGSATVQKRPTLRALHHASERKQRDAGTTNLQRQVAYGRGVC